jgi:hypothetical protein
MRIVFVDVAQTGAVLHGLSSKPAALCCAAPFCAVQRGAARRGAARLVWTPLYNTPIESYYQFAQSLYLSMTSH